MDEIERKEHYKMMTETPVPRLIWRLAIPTIISMLVSSIYNTADTFFVSQLGTSAAGAVAITASTGFSFALVLSLLLSIFGIAFQKDLMRLLGATETILPYAEAYAEYIFLGCPVMCLSFVMNNYLRAEGKAMYGMIGITIGGVLNIFLDPIFIFTLGFGTAGAAMATALSQLISFCILLSFFLRGKSSVRISLMKVSRDIKLYLKIVLIGLPTLMRQGLASIASVALNVAAAAFGDAAVAAMSITGRIMMFAFSAMLGFGQGFQPVSSFNYGAKRFDRVRLATKYTAFVGTILMLCVSALCIILAPAIMKAFRKDDLEVIAIGVYALRAQALLLPLTGIVTATNMGLQSTGNAVPATVLAMARQGIFFIPLILILPGFAGLKGVALSQPISDGLTFIIALFFFASFLRMLKKKENTEEAVLP